MAMIGALAALAMLGMQPVATEVTAPGSQGPLAGTLLAPQGEAQATVLMLPGSGPSDRDGNSPAGVSGGPYRQLAEALAARGIATVRFDKRGIRGSHAAGNPNMVTIGAYADDVRSWLPVVRARTGASCVWLLSHSEGGLVALAARESEGVCGLVLVASPGRRVSDVLREQLRANPANAPLLPQAMAAVDQLEAGQRVDATQLHPALQPLFAAPLQSYWIDLFSHDPALLLSGYDRPVLIVQGQRDLQVTEADARRLAAANPEARLVLLPDVNHVLRRVTTDDRSANAATYMAADMPIDGTVPAAIADFLAGQARP